MSLPLGFDTPEVHGLLNQRGASNDTGIEEEPGHGLPRLFSSCKQNNDHQSGKWMKVPSQTRKS